MDISKLQDTAYYVFDFRALGQRIDDLRSLLGENIQLAYAIKANPFLVKGALPKVERLEICSPGESRICDALGVDPRVGGRHRRADLHRGIPDAV